MNKDLLKFMDKHNIDDGLLREFLFKGKMDAALIQIQKTWRNYSNIISAIDELTVLIEE